MIGDGSFLFTCLGKLIAEYSTQISQTPAVAYMTTDHLGSPRVITDATGQVTSRRDFMPFGEDLNAGVGNRTGDTGLKYSMPGDNIRQNSKVGFAPAIPAQGLLGRIRCGFVRRSVTRCINHNICEA